MILKFIVLFPLICAVREDPNTPCKTSPEEMNVDTGNSPLTEYYNEAKIDLSDLQSDMERLGTDHPPQFKRAAERDRRITSFAL